MERFAENADVDKVRNFQWQHAQISVTVVPGKEEEGAKFRDYFEHNEPLKTASHRALAILRGRNEGILTFSLRLERRRPQRPESHHPLRIHHCGSLSHPQPAPTCRCLAARSGSLTWRIKIGTYVETELVVFGKPLKKKPYGFSPAT